MKIAVFLFAFAIFLSGRLESEDRFAVVIGNADYALLGRLKNPKNDASDVSECLRKLGFKVTLVLNGDLQEMESAVVQLGKSLRNSLDSVGFFYYSGHGIQSNGENFLIPTYADIPSEDFLKTKALSAQSIMDTVQSAKNKLNILVLDACRTNPFGWSRSSNRGLAPVSAQAPGSIVVYATSANSVASDGLGRNGTFTASMLRFLPVPGLEIKEVFNQTGADVVRASGRKQIPAVYNQFFDSVSLSGDIEASIPTASGLGGKALLGGIIFVSDDLAEFDLSGKTWRVAGGQPLSVSGLSAGTYEIDVHYSDGTNQKKKATVLAGQMVTLPLSHSKFPLPSRFAIGSLGPAGGIVFYDKGNNEGGWRYLEAASSDLASRLGAGITWNEAFDRARLLSQGGATNWRIPTISELRTLYLNLFLTNVGGLRPFVYWSATEDTPDAVKTLFFKDGSLSRLVSKTSLLPVRPIRSFLDPTEEADAIPTQYKIGDFGPGGGIVFLDLGRVENGWRYLEVTTLNFLGTWYEALAKAREYRGNGFWDWRLPTREELAVLSGNLNENFDANFSGFTYWSCDEYGNNQAYTGSLGKSVGLRHRDERKIAHNAAKFVRRF